MFDADDHPTFMNESHARGHYLFISISLLVIDSSVKDGSDCTSKNWTKGRD
jgi:hypothetical protein